MAKAPAFQLYAADFYMDTVGWTATEVGAYFRLLLHEWVNGPLPDDIMRLARIAGIDHKTMGKFWTQSVGKKFVKTDRGTWENSRLEQTRNEQEEYKQKLIKSGRLGGLKTQEEKRKTSSEALSKASSENEALQSSSSSTTSVLDKTTLKDDDSVNTESLSPNVSGDDKSTAHCPHSEIVKLYHEILPSLQKVKEWTEQRQKILRTRWNEKEERQTLEWWRLFFQYVSESDFLMGRIKPTFQADLEWLVRPKNFVKVIEGKYHRNGNVLLSQSSAGILGWADRERKRMEEEDT